MIAGASESKREAGRAAPLLDDLIYSEKSLRAIARSSGLDLEELIAALTAPDAARLLTGAALALDARAALALGRSRFDAVRRLKRIAMTASSEETARKACVDLLKESAHERLTESRAERGGEENGEGDIASIEKRLLQMLERIGAAGDAEGEQTWGKEMDSSGVGGAGGDGGAGASSRARDR